MLSPYKTDDSRKYLSPGLRGVCVRHNESKSVFDFQLIGLGLIFGVLTGIAAFFGVFMNLNFMLAGAVSINPIIGMLAILIVLAWRIAGYYGLDSVLLPLLGTPWTGSLARTRRA